MFILSVTGISFTLSILSWSFLINRFCLINKLLETANGSLQIFIIFAPLYYLSRSHFLEGPAGPILPAEN